MNTNNEIESLLMPFIEGHKGDSIEGDALRRMYDLMLATGNPHQRLKAVHIAGTSGKTSTAYYLAAMLNSAKVTVGLTVSPHVDSITERLQIDGEPLSDKKFQHYLKLFLDMAAKSTSTPTYFELLYGFAVWVFAELEVDYAVVETGIGGMFDATNVLRREDKICVITDIGFDHMDLLGSELIQIAAQKAGIMHSGSIAATYEKPADIMEVLYKRAADVGAQLVKISEQEIENYRFDPTMPDYQKRNWTLAKRVFDIIAKRDGLESTTEDITKTQHTYIPGRMDVTKRSGVTLIMDGAHNAQKIKALVESIVNLYPAQQAVVLIALKLSKDLEGIAEALRPIANKVIVTEFISDEYLRAQAVPAQVLLSKLQDGGLENVISEPNPYKAYDLAHRYSEGLILITGSFYLLSQLREYIKKTSRH